jgi:hypothetical protein
MESTQDEQPVVALDDGESPMFSDLTSMEESTPDLGPVVAFALADPEPEEELQAVVVFDEPEPEDHPVREPHTAVQKSYSSKEVAKDFFGKSTQWLYWGMRDKDPKGNPVTPVFVYQDGTPIEPIQIGKGKRRRYTLPIIKEMALACYNRGNLKERGYWEASGSTAGKGRVTEQGATAGDARSRFRTNKGFEPAEVVFVDGLLEVLARVRAAEKDVISV